jgi:hypothetical protein
VNILELQAHTDAIDHGRYVEAVRSDGLRVFYDKSEDPISEWLNIVRASGTRQQVIMAVGIARGLQIAQRYARQYGTEGDQSLIAAKIEACLSSKLLPHLDET